MSSIAMSRDAFMPRSTGGGGPGFVVSILIHLALVAALALGVRWHASEPEGVEAELWAAVPQIAAPPVVEPPSVVKPEPPVVTPPPVVKPEPVPDAQIAIERAKRDEKLRKQKQLADEEAEKRLADKKKALDEEKKRKADEARLAAQHEAQVKRILAQAGATGDPTSPGRATQTAGPSAGYGGRIKARIKPNIIYSHSGSSNPLARVELRMAPEGTIMGKRLVNSSGIPSFDEAVLRAIDKTETLPRDIDGRVPPLIEIDFRPLD